MTKNGDRLLRAARPRNIILASSAVWTAAELMHAAHTGVLDPALLSVAATGAAYGGMSRAGRGDKNGHRHAAQAAVTTAISGAWFTLASQTGPLAGRWDAMTLTLAAGTTIGIAVLNRHAAVQAARRWRHARHQWLHEAPLYGLTDSHLIRHEPTRLGERLEVDVSDTGRLASSLANGSLAEQIATRRKIPRSRVKVDESPIAGRVSISIRQKDPWARPILHPLLDPSPEITLPPVTTIRKPLIVGQDPETGEPLTLAVWDAHGGRNVYVIGKKGAGKTVLLSCITERLTACDDVLVIRINLSKGIEDLEWARACHLTAIGPGDAKKALRILRLVRKIIDARGATPRDDKVFQPSAEHPAVVVIIDEIDTASNAPAIKHELSYIASKDRSESVCLVEAGQRGTAEWAGGSDVRSQLDVVCAGKVKRRGEILHAAGEAGMNLPDMASYGEGHAGVWAIVEDGGDYEIGRSFDLSELPDIRQIAWDRRGRGPALEPATATVLGDAYTALLTQQAKDYGDPDDEPGDEDASPPAAEPGTGIVPSSNPLRALAQAVLSGDVEVDDETRETLAAAEAIEKAKEQAWLDRADADLDLPDDLHDQLRHMAERNQDTRKILDSTEIPDVTDVTPEQMMAFRQARWDELAATTEIPPDARTKLRPLLEGDGTTISKAAQALGVSAWTMRKWLNRLRAEGVVRVHPQGRGSRWRLAGPGEVTTDGDDAPDGET